MKKFFTLLLAIPLLFLASCKKEAVEEEPLVTITQLKISREKIGVGQTIILSSAVSDSLAASDYRWFLNGTEIPNTQGKKEINWIPASDGKAVIKLQVTNSANRADEKSIEVNVQKCDCRNNLWTDTDFDVMLQETINGSDLISLDPNTFLFLTKKDSKFNGWQYDRQYSGEVVGYSFVDKKLKLCGIIFNKTYTSNSQEYYNDYVNIKDTRMTEYSHVKEEAIWQNSSLGDFYKARPYLWGHAIVMGVVIFRSHYTSSTSNIVVSIFS